ncbi:MAG: outer membrane beta-barrel protein [Bacteroidota bacterium]
MRKILSTAIMLCITCVTFSQNISLKGILKDTANKTLLRYGSVSLLRPKDSVLVKFTRSNTDGAFELKNILPANYILLISYPGLAEYVDIVDLKKDEDVGSVAMVTKAVALQNVIVRGGGAIRIKGDTMAFMADSFAVRDGATVEDLLKKLPGFQVNKKGEITAQGEKVEKVLVDGEEFFGDDPTLATQNLSANVVKEVQVFDKKSDQATFTGVDDGIKTKTINLKLKDDANKGYFGKLNLAGGLPNRWENTAMINKFRQKKKMSAFGVMGNTGKIGLGWQEESQYGGGGGGMEMEISDNGDTYFNNTDNEFGGMDNYYGEGLPSAWMGGLSYGNKFDNDKQNVNGSYRYQKQRITGGSSNISQYILPDTQYFNNQRSQSVSSKFRHKANLSYEITLDSTQTIKFTANGSMGESLNNSSFNSEALTGKGSMVNQSERFSNTLAKTGSFNSSLLWKKKLKKKGRTLSVSISENYNDNNSEGKLLNYNTFYTGGQFLKRDTTDQKKENDYTGLTIKSKVAYTEPIGKKGIVELSYAYNVVNSESKKLSFDKKDDKYETLNAVFSNAFKFNIGTHVAGAGYRFTDKKINFGLGGNIAQANWKQTDLFKDSVRKYDFTNLFPRANFQYKISQYSRISFNYDGNTTAPTLNQIQPVADNTDPLNVYKGNPALRQSFSQNFRITYNDYKVLSDRSIWTGITFSPTSNAFGTIVEIDSLGRNTYQTVNVDGNYRVNLNIYSGFKWAKPNIRIGLSGYGGVNRNNGFVNGRKNVTNSTNFNFDLSFNKNVEKKFEISLQNEVGYNISKSSIRPDVVTKYWTYKPTLDMEFILPWQIELSSDINYNWRQKTSVFDNNNNALLWNAAIEKKLKLKTDMKVGFKVNDILNQNLGFNRFINSTMVSEKTYDVIKRFWLLTLTWNFNKGPKKGDEW